MLRLKGKGTFEKIIKHFFYFRKSSRRNEELYETLLSFMPILYFSWDKHVLFFLEKRCRICLAVAYKEK